MPKALESPVMQMTQAPGSVFITDPVGPEKRIGSGEIETTPGTPQDLFTATVPTGETWKLRSLEVISRAYGEFDLLVGGVSVKDGKTGAAVPTVAMAMSPYIEVPEGVEIKVTFSQASGPVVPVEARIYYTDFVAP